MLFDVNEDTNNEYSIVSMIDNLLKRTNNLSKDELYKFVTVVLDNREIVYSEDEGYGAPFINYENRTMIPLRKPLEAIGAEVSYDNENRVVTAEKYNIVVKVPINEKHIYVNEQEVEIDTEAIIKDSRTYIPIRAVMEAFGYNVQWHNNSKTVIISN
jgi:chitinase